MKRRGNAERSGSLIYFRQDQSFIKKIENRFKAPRKLVNQNNLPKFNGRKTGQFSRHN